ncbi:hypothetical protein ACP4OV_027811 [Aristida adscensionis]
MEYAAAPSHAAAAAPAADPQHAHYPHPYAGYPYPYGAYHQHAPSADPSATAVVASSSYYYPVHATAPAAAAAATATAAAPYDPYAAYQYYAPPTGATVVGGGSGLAGYYFAAGEASRSAAASTQQAAAEATAAAGRETGKHFGFDPQRYAQAAAARASNGTTPPAAAAGINHGQWNAHFGHPQPKSVLRKQIKKPRKAVQTATCDVCKIQCDTLEVLMIHKQGKKHKKNMEKLQDSITPKPIKPPSNTIGPAPAPNCTVATVQPKKKKCSSAASPEELEVKKRRVLEAGAAQGEVKICTVCNVVVNSQKVYDFHIAGQKHQAMVQKQQALKLVV